MYPEQASVASLTTRVDVEHGLHIIVPGRNQRNAVYWMAKRGRVDYGRLTRLKIVNVDAEERAGVRCNLEPRLRTIGSGNDEYHSSSNRACGNCLVVFNLESCFRRCRAANRNLKKND